MRFRLCVLMLWYGVFILCELKLCPEEFCDVETNSDSAVSTAACLLVNNSLHAPSSDSLDFCLKAERIADELFELFPDVMLGGGTGPFGLLKRGKGDRVVD